MTKISQSTHILKALRKELIKQRKTESAGKSSKPSKHYEASKSSLERITPKIMDDLPERELNRVIVAGLLEEQLGAKLVSDPKFQSVIDKTVDAISKDKDLSVMLKNVSNGLVGQSHKT